MHKKTVVLSVLFGVAVGMNGGCATILSGTSQNIIINSEPPGAHVKLGFQSGKTPVTFRIPKGKDYPIEVTYESKKKLLSLTRTFDAISIINILFWPGFIVDAVTGAITKYDPDTFMVDFTEEE